MIKKTHLLFLPLMLILLWGCAHVGNPLPPLKKIPIQPKIERIYLRGGFLHIFATLPSKNRDGSPIKFFRRIILKSGIKKEKIDTLNIDSKIDKTLTFEKNEFYEIFTSKYNLHFKIDLNVIFPEKEKRFIFLQFINDAGRISPPSNFVEFITNYLLTPPEILKAKVKKDAIKITWRYNGKETVNGFNVYKSKDGKVFQKIGQTEKNYYQDGNFLFGVKYYYKIDAYKILEKFKIYSPFSKSVEVIPVDIFPPTPPQNPSFILENNICKLFWDPSLDKDLKGYLIYRKIDDGKWIKITQKPLKENIYEEKIPTYHKNLEYKITSIDKSGNESKPEKIITIKK